jgi:hypothetical protein
MAALLSSFTLTEVIIILIVAIPGICKGIKAIYSFYSGAKTRSNELREEGRQEALDEMETTQRFEKGEARID